MKFKQVKCKSGLMGEQFKLRDSYNNNFAEFEGYSNMYGIAKRLGYKTNKGAWRANPTVQCSTNPRDFIKV